MMVNQLVEYGCDYITVYSYEKLVEVNEAAKKVGTIQKICVRVIGEMIASIVDKPQAST